MLDRIEFLISEALTSLRRNKWMTFAAVTTSSMALLLLGGLGLAFLSIQSFAASLPSKLEMRVLLDMNLSELEVSQVGNAIEAMPEVGSVELITKEEAWEQMRSRYPTITEGLENVMPDGYKVTMGEIGEYDSVAAKIGNDEFFEPEIEIVPSRVLPP